MSDFVEIGQLPIPNLAGLLITAAIAGWTDWTEWRISNRLLAGSATAALMIAIFHPASVGLMETLKGGVIGLLLLLPLYLGRGMGGGDVKLMSVLGLHVGLVAIVQITFIAFMIGGLWSAFRWMRNAERWIAWHTWIQLQMSDIGIWSEKKSSAKTPEPLMWAGSRGSIPYGVVIALAAFVVGMISASNLRLIA